VIAGDMMGSITPGAG